MPPITRTAMVDDDGSGTTGTILNNAWKQELYGQIDALAAAPWIVPPFVASDYGVIGTGTWTVTSGDVVNTAYTIIGRTLFWTLGINQNALTGSPVGLSRKAFGNYPIARTFSGPYISGPVGQPAVVGYYETSSGAGSLIKLFRDINAAAAWTAPASIRAQGFYELA
jgi:hypothetical protein